jgi:Nif-specific regulatory protein
MLARAVHDGSGRSGEYVIVSCANLAAELFDSELFGHEKGSFTGASASSRGLALAANRGTLFLDEVGELPLTMQSRLLRLLQDRAFERIGSRTTQRADVRIVAATHRDLAALAEDGRFRRDLYYRLRVVEIVVAPLRDRGGDEVVSLAEHFLELYARRHERPGVTFTPGALLALRAHPWPGNVRELEHAVERAVVLCPGDRVEPAHLGLLAERSPAPTVTDGGVTLPLGLPLDEVERRYVAATLAHCHQNQSEAARVLGVGRNTLRRKSAPPAPSTRKR